MVSARMQSGLRCPRRTPPPSLDDPTLRKEPFTDSCSSALRYVLAMFEPTREELYNEDLIRHISPMVSAGCKRDCSVLLHASPHPGICDGAERTLQGSPAQNFIYLSRWASVQRSTSSSSDPVGLTLCLPCRILLLYTGTVRRRRFALIA
jgi:hypothetical protein